MNIKINVEANESNYIVITNEAVTATELLEFFKGLMYQMTYSEKTINNAILKLAEQIKQNKTL
jgi:hypothetical protein